MESLSMEGPRREEPGRMEGAQERDGGVRSFSGPLAELLAMQFTDEELARFVLELTAVGLDVSHVDRADEDTAREVSFLTATYFEIKEEEARRARAEAIVSVLS